MSINPKQLRDLIIVPTLKEMDKIYNSENKFNNKNASLLLLLTACAESECGYYLKQVKGEALSIFQIEENTFNYLKSKYPVFFKNEYFTFESLIYNLKYATIVARLKYFSIPEKIPDCEKLNDLISSMAIYWKKYYNTELGMGNEIDFILKSRELVKLI